MYRFIEKCYKDGGGGQSSYMSLNASPTEIILEVFLQPLLLTFGCLLFFLKETSLELG